MIISTLSCPWLYTSNTKTVLRPFNSSLAWFKSVSTGYHFENTPVAKAERKIPAVGSSLGPPWLSGVWGINMAFMNARRLGPAIISLQWPSVSTKPCRSALGMTLTSESPRLQSLGRVSSCKLGLDKPKNGISEATSVQVWSKILKG